MKQTLRSYSIITLGSVIFALSFDWFFSPNQVAMGGITGLAQVINALLPWVSVGVASFVLNVPLFLAGWKLIGFHLLASSLYSMAVCSVAIDAIAALYTFPPTDPMLACLCGGALMGLGLGMVFSQGSTTGGTDVVARLLKLKYPWLPMGKLVLVPDFVVLALAAAVFVSLYTLIGRVQRDHLSTTVYTFLTYSTCLLTLLVLDWATLTPVVGYGWKEVLIGLGLAVACTLLGHSLFSYSLKYLSPSYVSAAKLCEPIFASLLGIPLFGEIPGGVQVFGSVLVLAGVLLYTRAEA